ncbi:hypothetical protein T440DRAFT_1513 [Plenodomus tracheiphilus IPT5]|uniref:PH domain-containing protein n=1 Tax=Plenodomus tracheiphilus IPT5 TaxID=1408161 RepID=A0A6A7BNT7_9PLEO|nr:hypothetical protein T440DRAFT_1513 [Plenodomus tracheiphilus IPT5]
MEPATEAAARQPSRSRTAHHHSSSPSSPPTYGYHNTYHTHAQLPIGSPPSYARALEPRVLQNLNQRTQDEVHAARRTALPPSYSCSVEMEGIVGVKQELTSPFQVSGNREWYDVYAVLRGTQLSLHRIKNPTLFSRSQKPTQGKLLRTYSLQHSEVGIASDFKKTAIIPKSPFAHLVPAAARPKLYETDPHLFEPVREHAIRLRLELEQFLLCTASEETMLDWIEALTAAIDISSPLEDRSEPRYRSLPRRNRRQRVLDGSSLGENLEQLSDLEAGRRIIEQQEQIIRTLYPHLAATAREPGTNNSAPAAENELEEFDPEDVRFPTRSVRDSLRPISSQDEAQQIEEERTSTPNTYDPKFAPRIQPSPSYNLRYRRRCAPVLLASSPRVSDVVFCQGQRVRINVKDTCLVEYTSHPPRYDAHNFPKSKSKRPSRVATSRATPVRPTATAEKTAPAEIAPMRPSSPIRGVSDDSISSISFGEDLAPARSGSHGPEEIEIEMGVSGPPSPTGLAHVKGDAARQLEIMGKRRASEEGGREEGLSAVVLGAGLVI